MPRIDIVHDVSKAERSCACGTPMVQIGEEVREQFDIVSMRVRVLRHILKPTSDMGVQTRGPRGKPVVLHGYDKYWPRLGRYTERSDLPWAIADATNDG